MSKAFVNEDNDSGGDLDNEPEDELDQDSEDGLDASETRPAASAKNYMTQNGAQRLKSELHELLTVERPKLVETVAWAAGNGDRSENADYIYGKRRLREIDRRIRFLTRRLDIIEIVDPTLQTADRVLFGATVTVLHESGQEKIYQVVGIDETDAKRGRISWISPIGKALLQSRVGDVAVLRTPKGEEELEIMKIEYVAID